MTPSMEQDSPQPAAGQTESSWARPGSCPACASPRTQLVLQPAAGWVSPCPQSLGGSGGDPRPFAFPSSPGLGAWSQSQATQEPSSQAHCSLCLALGAPACGSRHPLCPGRFTRSATFATPNSLSCRERGRARPLTQPPASPGEPRAQGSSSPPQFQPDALGL